MSTATVNGGGAAATQLAPLKQIREIADQLEIADEHLNYYGKYTAKLSLELLEKPVRPGAKLILVTAVTPTKHGEGKTVTSIGLGQALSRLGKQAIVTLREPSLGPVFGLKGGATGGGLSKVEPSEQINLHFNGDFHAITAAHNLLAALIDAHLYHGNELDLDVDNIFWPRTLDINDRALRHAVVGLGGKANGIPRETGFVITAASEIMAILGLASSREDLRKRLGDIVIGFNTRGEVVHARDLNATGALMVLLSEAVCPNLVQTTEHTAALVHTGPFANIAHGTSSAIAQQMGMRLADYVINESGFAADLGAEKFFDLVMPATGLKPAAAVLVASLRAVAAQSGSDALTQENLEKGVCNLTRHIQNLHKFGVPVVVCVNRFPGDTQEHLDWLLGYCRQLGARAALSEVFTKGGEGGMELGREVLAAAGTPSTPVSLYDRNASLFQKVETVATSIYGAGSVYFESQCRRKLERLTKLGFGTLPVCIAKTQNSLSDNPKLLGSPEGYTFTATSAYLANGAGFVVVTAGDMLLMPGLGKTPSAMKMDVDAEGRIVGLE
jgi:formate--tetrahydrofolate ligase